MPIRSPGSVILRSMHRAMGTLPGAMSIWAMQQANADAFLMGQGQTDADRDLSMFWLTNGTTKLARHRNPGIGDSGQIEANNNASLKLVVANYASASSRSSSFDGVLSAANTTALTDDLASHDAIFLLGHGSGNDTGSLFFIGAIAEGHFYTKPLTQTQITALKNGTSKPEDLVDTDGTTSIWIDGWQLKTNGDMTSMKNGWVLSPIGSGVITTETTLPHPVSRTTPVPVSFSGPVPTRNGIVGTAASFANAGFFAGNETPFVYSNVGAALPAGLSLSSSTGIISGTPTTGGTTSGIIIRATDTGSNVANTNSYSIVIAATNAAPTFPGNISNISGTAGTAITPVNVSGQFSDTDALTYSASPAGTAWPSGLVVNSSTGIISGTVASAGTTTGLKVRATDTASQTVDSNAFNVVIGAAGSTVTITSPSAGGKRTADGTYRAGVACNVTALDKATHAVLERKTGLTSPASGPFVFTSTVLTAGTERLFLVKADADDKDLGAFFATPV